jgi:hypothetical protein
VTSATSCSMAECALERRSVWEYALSSFPRIGRAKPATAKAFLGKRFRAEHIAGDAGLTVAHRCGVTRTRSRVYTSTSWEAVLWRP